MKKQDIAAFSLTRTAAERPSGTLAARLVRALALYAGLLALLQGFAGIWTHAGLLWLAVGLTAAIWQGAALCAKRSWLRAVLPLLSLLAAAIFAEQTLAGVLTVLDTACDRLTAATGRIWLPPAGERGAAALFVCLAAALLGVFCAHAVRRSPVGCGIALTALFLAAMLLLRPAHAESWMLAYPVSALILLAGGAAERGAPVPALAAQGVLLAAAGLLAAALFCVPAMRSGTLFSEWRASGSAALHRLRYESGAKVLPEGNFEEFTAAAEQTPCLTVTMEQPETLYLRGFTGDIFTGTAWTQTPVQTLAAQSDLLYWLHKDGFYPQTQLSAAQRGLRRQDETQTVRVENTGACSAYIYVPYALSALPQGFALTANSLQCGGVPAGGLRGTRRYQFTIPSTAGQITAEVLQALAGQPEDAAAYLSQEGSYRLLVQVQELEIPEQARAQLAQVLDEICRDYGTADSLTAEQAQVCTLRFLQQLDALRESGTPLPLDALAKDTSYQTATLTVLALRYYGVPARYAEGFVLTQETAARTAPNEPVQLTGGDAQAWAEVYQDGVGWMPLALTPGYGELTDMLSEHHSGAAGQEHDESSEAGSVSQAQTVEDVSDETENTPQEEPDGGAQSASEIKRWLGWILALGLLLALLAAIALRYALIRRRWRYRFTQTAPAQAISWVAKALTALWNAMGLGYEGGSIFAFAESLRDQDEAYAEAVRELAALNAEARFSSHAMTPEQAQQARQIWQQTAVRLPKTCALPRRMWLKWIRCLY